MARCKADTAHCCHDESVETLEPCHHRLRELTHSVETEARGDSTISSIDANVDIEKGPPIVEHVVISVQGMTCSGCETQLLRCLQTTPEVIGNIQISLVLSRAEFDLDVGRLTVEGLLARLHRQTSYKYHQILDEVDGQALDIVPQSSEDQFILDEPFPEGVISISTIPKGNIRISFDANIVGARTLVEKSFGRKLTLAPPPQDPSLAAGKEQVRREGMLFGAAAVLTIPVLVLAWAPLPQDGGRSIWYHSISFTLATTVQLGVVLVFYRKAFRDLFHARVIELALLITLSTSAAYIYSVVAFAYFLNGKPLKMGEFFETSTLLVTLIMLGRFVGEYSRQKATESVSIRSLQSQSALLVLESSHKDVQSIDSRLLEYGDVFRVPHDSRIVTDGIVVFGGSEVDESMVTGESRLVAKGVGSNVIAGSINRTGTLHVRLTKLPSENTIHEIATLVDRGELEKPRAQEIADKIAGWFVPLVVVITIAVFLAQFLTRVYLRGVPTGEAAASALTFAIATLVVSCPCAVGLAVPMVVVIARGVAAKMGVVFKDPRAIENGRKMKHVVLDKTGTLTEGSMKVVVEYLTRTTLTKLGLACEDSCCASSKDLETNPVHESSTDSLLLGLIEGSKHPVSQAIAAYLRFQGVQPDHIHNVVSLPGKGIEGDYQGKSLRAGSPTWTRVEGSREIMAVQAKRLSCLCFTIDGALTAVYGLENPIRREARAVVSALQKRGTTVHIVSGDNEAAVQDVARLVGVPARYVKAQASPAEKQEYIRQLLSGNRVHGQRNPTSKGGPVVVFCGDGTNDAPALRLATIGVHMLSSNAYLTPSRRPKTPRNPFHAVKSGVPLATTSTCASSMAATPTTSPRPSACTSTSLSSEVANAAADVILVYPDLRGLLILQDASSSAWWRMVLNFAWAGLYNVAALLGAAGAFETVRGGKGWRVPPEFAAVGELVSVLPVVAVAMTLTWTRGRWGKLSV